MDLNQLLNSEIESNAAAQVSALPWNSLGSLNPDSDIMKALRARQVAKEASVYGPQDPNAPPSWVNDDETQQMYNVLKWQHELENAATAKQWERNEQSAQAAFDRSLLADSTKVQRYVEDLRKAGINPMVAFMHGASGASGVTSSAAQASKPDYEKTNISSLMGSQYGADSAKSASNLGSILGFISSVGLLVGGIISHNPALIGLGAGGAVSAFSGKLQTETTTYTKHGRTRRYTYYD